MPRRAPGGALRNRVNNRGLREEDLGHQEGGAPVAPMEDVIGLFE